MADKLDATTYLRSLVKGDGSLHISDLRRKLQLPAVKGILDEEALGTLNLLAFGQTVPKDGQPSSDYFTAFTGNDMFMDENDLYDVMSDLGLGKQLTQVEVEVIKQNTAEILAAKLIGEMRDREGIRQFQLKRLVAILREDKSQSFFSGPEKEKQISSMIYWRGLKALKPEIKERVAGILESIEATFAFHDTNGDRFINYDELAKLNFSVEGFHPGITKEEIVANAKRAISKK